MYLINKWNEIMGPKDEYLEAQECKATKQAAYILLTGSIITLYYVIMLNQVASTTENPITTPLGASLIPVEYPLIATILIAGVASLSTQIKAGSFSSYKRFAEVDRIPWNFVTAVALLCGIILALLTSGMRIVAEIQIVGFDQVAWLGDFAIGIVFFLIAFGLGFAFTACAIHSAIIRRRQREIELDNLL